MKDNSFPELVSGGTRRRYPHLETSCLHCNITSFGKWVCSFFLNMKI